VTLMPHRDVVDRAQARCHKCAASGHLAHPPLTRQAQPLSAVHNTSRRHAPCSLRCNLYCRAACAALAHLLDLQPSSYRFVPSSSVGFSQILPMSLLDTSAPAAGSTCAHAQQQWREVARDAARRGHRCAATLRWAHCRTAARQPHSSRRAGRAPNDTRATLPRAPPHTFKVRAREVGPVAGSVPAKRGPREDAVLKQGAPHVCAVKRPANSAQARRRAPQQAAGQRPSAPCP
jgi:hypothetical protein